MIFAHWQWLALMEQYFVFRLGSSSPLTFEAFFESVLWVCSVLPLRMPLVRQYAQIAISYQTVLCLRAAGGAVRMRYRSAQARN